MEDQEYIEVLKPTYINKYGKIKIAHRAWKGGCLIYVAPEYDLQ